MKKISMKSVIMGSVLAVAAVSSMSANAAALPICTGGVATDGATVGTGSFVKVSFKPKCSANVLLYGDDASVTLYKVGSASLKGKTVFAGSSLGGAVGNVGVCGASPCTTGEVTAAITALPGS